MYHLGWIADDLLGKGRLPGTRRVVVGRAPTLRKWPLAAVFDPARNISQAEKHRSFPNSRKE